MEGALSCRPSQRVLRLERLRPFAERGPGISRHRAPDPCADDILIRTRSTHDAAEEALGTYKDVDAVAEATRAIRPRAPRRAAAAEGLCQGLNRNRKNRPAGQ